MAVLRLNRLDEDLNSFKASTVFLETLQMKLEHRQCILASQKDCEL